MVLPIHEYLPQQLKHSFNHPKSSQINKCLSIKGAEDTLNKPFSFEVSTSSDNLFFIADSEKVRCVKNSGFSPGLWFFIWLANRAYMLLNL